MTFEKEYTVRWHDTGAGREVLPSRLLEFMQETASLQCRSTGNDLDSLHSEQGIGFVLMRLSMRFYRPIHAFDRIRVQTWVTDGRGLQFPRYFRVMRGEEILAEASSSWALIDFSTRQLIKVAAFDDSGFPKDDPLSPFSGLPLRLAVPKELPLLPVGEREVRYADIDYNLHMNNTKYPDMLLDFLPDREKVRVTSMVLSFLHEAHYKDTLSISLGKEEGDVYWFRSVRSDGTVGIEARFTTEPIETNL